MLSRVPELVVNIAHFPKHNKLSRGKTAPARTTLSRLVSNPDRRSREGCQPGLAPGRVIRTILSLPAFERQSARQFLLCLVGSDRRSLCSAGLPVHQTAGASRNETNSSWVTLDRENCVRGHGGKD
jgi:hypothetical protein